MRNRQSPHVYDPQFLKQWDCTKQQSLTTGLKTKRRNICLKTDKPGNSNLALSFSRTHTPTPNASTSHRFLKIVDFLIQSTSSRTLLYFHSITTCLCNQYSHVYSILIKFDCHVLCMFLYFWMIYAAQYSIFSWFSYRLLTHEASIHPMVISFSRTDNTFWEWVWWALAGTFV